MTLLEALEKSKSFTLMSKGSIKAAQKMIAPTEEILWAVITNVNNSPVRGELDTKVNISDVLSGVVAVTDQRIFFVNSVLGRGKTKEIRLSDIRSVDAKFDDVYATLRIVGTSSMIVTTNGRLLISDLRDAINVALCRKDSKTGPVSNADKDELLSSDVEQLKSLKELYDSGVITEEEFSAKKAQILNL